MRDQRKDTEKFYSQFLVTLEKFIPESYFQKHLSESKRFELFENPQFQELLKHSPAIVGIFNHATMGYEFMSDNIESITGHAPQLYLKPGGMEYALSTFPEPHAAIYTQKIFPTMLEYFQNNATTNEIKKYRFTATFQLIKKDKTTLWCLQQLNVIDIDENGLPLLTLLFMSDITHLKKDSDVDFVIAKKDQDGVYQTEYTASYLSEKQTLIFTKRELELLQLLAKGLSSSQIAEQLFISENTVNTHRQNMLEKTAKKNTAELLTFAIGKGFIKI